MIVAIAMAVLGLAGIALGCPQLSGVLPLARRAVRLSAVMNIAVGIFLLALAILRAEGLL